MLAYAWVGGSIWGVQLGGLVSVVLGLVVLRANWRRSQGTPSQELFRVTRACPNKCPPCGGRPARTANPGGLCIRYLQALFSSRATSDHPATNYETAVGFASAGGDSIFFSS